jgi:DNA (cytosine-5)-methyltransferase 1
MDGFCAQWLRNLIEAGQLPQGTVDERSIVEVQPDDIRSARQVHLFAGIGGWAYALRLADWPDSVPVWTGSCPCQPLSCAGKRRAAADERHLWPAMFRLIRECRPATVFGEQVGGRLGLEWLAGVRTDLEGAGYAVGAADLPAACVGAPHIRQRLYWVAYCGGEGLAGLSIEPAWQERETVERGCGAGGLANAESERGRIDQPEREPERRAVDWRDSPWTDAEWIACADGKARRIPLEPGIFPLAHGIPNRVGTLRGAGNAIIPQVAATFIRAVMSSLAEQT